MMNRFSWLVVSGVAVLLTACDGGDCPDGFAKDNNGNCIQVGGNDGGDGGDNSGGDGGNNDGGDNGGNDAPPSGAAVGEVCSDSSECASNLCVFQYGGDVTGICTEGCNSWSDCSESFWECCDLSNGGFVCTPDSWVDEFDLTCN